MNEIEAAAVEVTDEGDYLNIETADGVFAFGLTEDAATEIMHTLRDWLHERRAQ